MNKQMESMIESLKNMVEDKEQYLSDACFCLKEIKDKIILFENKMSEISDISLKETSKIYKITKAKILSKDKSYNNSNTKKAAEKKQPSNKIKDRINWRNHIVEELKKDKKLSTAQLLQRFEDMDLIPKEDGRKKTRITKNARSAIGWCTGHEIIQKTKDGKFWELGSKAI